MSILLSGKMPTVWLAKWIDPEGPHDEKERQNASVLRRVFTVTEAEPGGKAVLYITCHGLYEAKINGRRVGDFVLAPGTGDYKQRLLVQAYDVSDLLMAGENELMVTLGDGWYRGNVGVDGLYNYYGTDVALLCQLEINGQAVLCSDDSWQATQEGPTRLNDLEKGETYDARRDYVENGFYSKGSNGTQNGAAMPRSGSISGWHRVRVRDFGYENLCADTFVPILEQERFEGKILTAPNGETVIDFGQNLAGYTEIRIQAKEGQTLTLWHGETLDENGNFTQANYDPGDRNKNGGIPQKLSYICKDGLNIWKPRFSIFGFRYAKVETDADLEGASFTAIAVYSMMPQTGFFECGNEDVNRLFLNSLWSMRSNFVDVPTDCPTRERAGWTGDAGVFAPTAVYLADCLPIYRKWLGECRLAQGADGLVQNIAPVNNSGSMISNMLQGSAGWGDACILAPWALYNAYGDKTILEENYNMMCRWLSFCEKRAKKTRIQNRKNPYRKYLVDEGFHFGEWCEPDVSNMESMKKTMMQGAPEVATAYYYRSASTLAKIAAILGKEEDAKKYEEIAEGARRAYRYTCTKKGVIESKRQAEFVRPIAFGLLKEKEADAATAQLNELVIQNDYHLNTGFLSTPDLCRVLADHGYVETAYRLLLQDTCPSWLYAVKKGATTIWETWDGIKEDGTVRASLNHYSYGAISGWLFNGVCGIRLSQNSKNDPTQAPATLIIQPKPHPSLGFAKARWESPVGTIRSEWKYEDMENTTIAEKETAKGVRKLVLDISVPIPATILLPNGETHNVEEGEHHYEVLL